VLVDLDATTDANVDAEAFVSPLSHPDVVSISGHVSLGTLD